MRKQGIASPISKDHELTHLWIKKAGIFFVIYILGLSNFGAQQRQLSSFRSRDLFGRLVDSRSFGAHYTYVHFIKPSIVHERELIINEVIQEFSDNSSIIIVFILPDSALPRIRHLSSNVFFVADKGGKLHKQLNAPSCCESFKIYNDQQELIWEGANHSDYRKDIRPYLIEILRNPAVRSFDSIFFMDKIRKSGLLHNLESQLDRSVGRKPINIIGMVSSACSVCPIGEILREMNSCAGYHSPPLNIIVFVTNEFSDIDINNFQSTFNIKYPVVRAVGEIAVNWSSLMGQYPGLFNNFFFVIDDNQESVFLLKNISDFKNYILAVSR